MKNMKSMIVTFVAMISTAAVPARACQVEVNDKAVARIPLKNGAGTIVNENGSSTVLVSCGEFNGQVVGINRVERLQPGMCSLLSNSGQLSLVECE